MAVWNLPEAQPSHGGDQRANPFPTTSSILDLGFPAFSELEHIPRLSKSGSIFPGLVYVQDNPKSGSCLLRMRASGTAVVKFPVSDETEAEATWTLLIDYVSGLGCLEYQLPQLCSGVTLVSEVDVRGCVYRCSDLGPSNQVVKLLLLPLNFLCFHWRFHLIFSF